MNTSILRLLTPLSFSIVALCLFNPAAAKEPESTSSLPTIQVSARKVETGETMAMTEVTGTVQAVQRAVIASKVSGAISEILVVLGSKVQQGDLLVKISAGEISARVLQAQAQLEQAARNLERERKLLEKKAATAESVKSLEDLHRVAQAAYQEAETMLDYTVITAPFPGQITGKPANAGDLALPGMPLLYIENSDRLQVEAFVPEALVLGIDPGDRLAVHVPAADVHLTGIVAEVAPAADPLSRTAPVKLDIEPNPRLRPGQFARVRIPSSSSTTLYIPAQAVVVHGQMEKVFVVENGKAHLRLVRTTRIDHEGRMEILAGLTGDDIVIVENNLHLIDGQPVTVLP